MRVVSNASPLINLARIGKLTLLRDLYGELIVPEAVWQEVVVEGAGQPGADEVASATWIKTQAATNRQLVNALQQDLDAGEAEAIALTLEIGAELLLMDEKLGRETDRHLGLRYVGLVGALVEAKRRGLIRAVKTQMDALRDIAGFRVVDALYARVLQDEGEVVLGNK
jgi:predicted nucleic acid-binding protein